MATIEIIRLGKVYGNPVQEVTKFIQTGTGGMSADDPRATIVSGQSGAWVWQGSANFLGDPVAAADGSLLNPADGILGPGCELIDQTEYDSLMALRTPEALTQILLDALGV